MRFFGKQKIKWKHLTSEMECAIFIQKLFQKPYFTSGKLCSFMIMLYIFYLQKVYIFLMPSLTCLHIFVAPFIASLNYPQPATLYLPLNTTQYCFIIYFIGIMIQVNLESFDHRVGRNDGELCEGYIYMWIWNCSLPFLIL